MPAPAVPVVVGSGKQKACVLVYLVVGGYAVLTDMPDSLLDSAGKCRLVILLVVASGRGVSDAVLPEVLDVAPVEKGGKAMGLSDGFPWPAYRDANMSLDELDATAFDVALI